MGVTRGWRHWNLCLRDRSLALLQLLGLLVLRDLRWPLLRVRRLDHGINRPLFRGHGDLSLLGLHFLRQRLAVARTRITEELEKEAISTSKLDKQGNDIFQTKDNVTYELPIGRPKSFSLGRAMVEAEGALWGGAIGAGFEDEGTPEEDPAGFRVGRTGLWMLTSCLAFEPCSSALGVDPEEPSSESRCSSSSSAAGGSSKRSSFSSSSSVSEETGSSGN